jgi:hypothetical protein
MSSLRYKGLWPFACWDCRIESCWGEWMFVSFECCVLSGRGLLWQADHSSRGVLLSVMCPMSVITKRCMGRPWTRNGLKCHTKKKNSTWPWIGPKHHMIKKIQLSFTAPNIATIYIVECKYFLFIRPSCPNSFSPLVHLRWRIDALAPDCL